MKHTILLLSLLISFSCNIDQNKTEENIINRSSENTISKDGSSVGKKDNKKEEVDLKSAPDLNELITFLEKGQKSIPKHLYPILDLDTNNFESGNPYYITFYKKLENQRILMINKSYGATAILNMEGIRVSQIGEGTIQNSEEFNYSFELTPEIEMIHDIFIKITDKVHEYEENEAGAMEQISEEKIITSYIIIFDGKINKIEDFNKKELRLIRNYPFAKYGYRFKSEDLNSYYSKFDWYTADNENVDRQLTDDDKKIITYIQKLESN